METSRGRGFAAFAAVSTAKFLLSLFLLLALAGCGPDGFSIPPELQPEKWFPAGVGSPTPSLPPGSTPTGTNAATLTAAPQPGETLTPEPTQVLPAGLTLWVPPRFDPAGGTRAGDLLQARLDAFEEEYGVPVRVRVKSASGPGGLLESLSAASAAAPLALPGVIALPRSDLETAAIKGLVFPIDGLSQVIDETDWYSYARQLAMVQGETFALPFAGDALLLAYRPGQVVAPPADWEAISRLAQPLAFPAADAQSLLALTLYQSLDGQIEDAQRRPLLQPEILSQVLQKLGEGEQSGVFPYWLSQYETYAQTWQAYHDGRVNALVTWSSDYLSELPVDTAAMALPSLSEKPLTQATGWGWAVAEPDPERRALSVRLAEFLADGAFLADWTEAAGYLPTRPTSLAAWSDGSLQTLLSTVAISAQARPSNDLLAVQGPVLKEAILSVLKRESDPTQAAQQAAERLSAPQNP